MDDGAEYLAELNKVSKRSVSHLWKAGKLLENISPELSRFYVHQMQELSRSNQITVHTNHQFCVHCGSLWNPKMGRYQVKLNPRPALNKRLRKLHRAFAERPHTLSKSEKRLIAKLKDKTNQLEYSCHVCNKKSRYSGRRKTTVPQTSTARRGQSTPQLSVSVRPPKLIKSDLRKRSLLNKVLEKELQKTPVSSASRNSLKNFLRSV